MEEIDRVDYHQRTVAEMVVVAGTSSVDVVDSDGSGIVDAVVLVVAN